MLLYLLCQRNLAGNPAAAPSARGGLPASSWQRPAEPDSAGWAATSQACLLPEHTAIQCFNRQFCLFPVQINYITVNAFSAAVTMNNLFPFSRQRKDELEQRMSTLQESRRELMVQLEQLMMLLKVPESRGGVMGVQLGTLTSLHLVTALWTFAILTSTS